MNVSLNRLNQICAVASSPEALADRFAALGFEIDGIRRIPGAFDGVVVAQVITRDKHPNADKLSLCRVNDGQGERQIVCGAQNFKPGDKVPLILPGASLPLKPGETQPFTIKVGKIRGCESHGMMCSPQELGLPDAVEGLLILKEDARVGQAFADYLGRDNGDYELTMEPPPDRPDLQELTAAARELAAAFGNAAQHSPAAAPDGAIPARPITLRHALVHELLGIEIPAPKQIQTLQLAGLMRSTAPEQSPEATEFLIPAERTDLRQAHDLVHEIARLSGFENLPAFPMPTAHTAASLLTISDRVGMVRQFLAEHGCTEGHGGSRLARVDTSTSATAASPGPETVSLRSSLLPGVLTTLRQNANRKNPAAKVFEIGCVFSQTAGQWSESRRVVIAMNVPADQPGAGPAATAESSEPSEFQALVATLLERIGHGDVRWANRDGGTPGYTQSKLGSANGKEALGEIGLVHPAFAEQFALRDPVFVADLALD